MLTSDLLRYRLSKKRVKPTLLDPDSERARHKAEQLTSLFEAGSGRAQGDIAAEVDAAIGHGTDFIIWRGLAKLLYDRSDFATGGELDPVALRRAVFELAAELGPVTDDARRAIVLQAAAERLKTSVEACEQGLYADLQARQLLVGYKPLAPLELLHRYNLAQAQGILYKATRLEITLEERDPNKLRYLFQILKFHGLMHRLYQDASQGSWRVEVDGPASLLRQNRKYGLKMAIFLPALVLMERWSLIAELHWSKSKRDVIMELDQGSGLVSHYRATGQWLSDAERMLEDRFEGYETPWRLKRQGTLLALGENQVLVPDYVLSHPDGRVAFVEVIGFWRKSYLERRLEALKQLKTPLPLVLVISQGLNSARDKFEQVPASCVFFKTAIILDRVIAAAEEVAS